MDIKRLNYNRVPAVLFRTESDREKYIDEFEPMSFRYFEYEIEPEYWELDLEEWKPLVYPNL